MYSGGGGREGARRGCTSRKELQLQGNALQGNAPAAMQPQLQGNAVAMQDKELQGIAATMQGNARH